MLKDCIRQGCEGVALLPPASLAAKSRSEAKPVTARSGAQRTGKWFIN